MELEMFEVLDWYEREVLGEIFEGMVDLDHRDDLEMFICEEPDYA